MTIVRVVRNLRDAPFAWRADDAALARVGDRCRAALQALDPTLRPVPPRRVAGIRRVLFLPPRAAESRRVTLLCAPPRRRRAALVNGIDHLLLLHARPGLDAVEATARALRAADRLDRRLRFARAGRWGWLAASPADCGAGVRVLWIVPAARSPSAPARLNAAGLALAPAGRGLWQATHRRPLPASPARQLRRYEDALRAVGRLP